MSGPAYTFGSGLTKTVVSVVSLHVYLFVPIIVYFVVIVGVATGFGQTLQDKPVAGDHAYCALKAAPLPSKVAFLPKQIVASVTSMIGFGKIER